MITLHRTTLSDGAHQALVESILSGRLTPGTEVSDVTLAQQLRVSRTPVREALTRLVRDGLVEQDPQRRFRVARFTREDVIEIYRMRGLLEAASAEAAAHRIDPADRDALRREAETLDVPSRDDAWAVRALEFDVRLHDTLARAAGNRRLQADIARYRLLVRAFCRITGSRENLHDAFREHLRILKALEAGDAVAARDAMADHVEARLQSVLRHLEGDAA